MLGERLWYSNQQRDWARNYKPPSDSWNVRRAKDGTIEVIDSRPFGVEKKEQDYRAGQVFEDRSIDLVYRVVPCCQPTDGWAVLDFWIDRYEVKFAQICDWVRRGRMEAALEQGSPTRYYRVRDENVILAELQELHPSRRYLIRHGFAAKKLSKKRRARDHRSRF